MLTPEEMAQAGAKLATSDDALARIARIASQQLAAELLVAEIEDKLATAKKTLRSISETDLPQAMAEAGIKTFTTQDEYIITVKDEVSCSIPAARAADAFQWLDKNGFGGLIKTDVITKFNRDQRKEADKIAKLIGKQGFDANIKQYVHPQTLKSFIMERLEDTAGPAVPLDLFGAFPYNVAVIKPTKKRKLSQTGN